VHSSAKLVEQLYRSLDRHDFQAMADCYHPSACFRDIAFDLEGKEQIRSMWQMICAGDIRATFEIVRADEASAVAKLVDEYTMSKSRRRVRNAIESRFRFQDGLILEHHDFCDARAWAAAAIGGIGGFFVGRLRFLRAWGANAKLRRFAQETAPRAANAVRS
jgi:ketosteroid isomerase-like protein